MANYFDQFDPQPAGANFFDQFDNAGEVTAGGLAKQLGVGAAKGLIGLAGMAGDIPQAIAAGYQRIFGAPDGPKVSDQVRLEAAHNAAFDPAILARIRSDGAEPVKPTIPGSAQIQGAVENFTGPFRKPQNIGEEYAQTVGEFAPGLLGGPGGLVRRAVGQVAIPAVTSETAGQVAREIAPELEAPLRIAGGIGGGIAGARLTAPRAAVAPVPTAQEIRNAAQAGFQHPEVAAVQIVPASVERLADRITADLNRRGQLAVPESAGATHAVVDRLRNTGNTPGLPQGVASIEELRSARMALGGMSTELNNYGRPTSNAVAAGRAGRQIDAYLDNLRQPDLIAGNAQRASAILREANRDWAAQAKAELVGLQQLKADRQAGRSGSGTNIENSMRQRIDSVFGPGKETAAGLTAAERAAADRIVEGSRTRNSLRRLGKVGFGDGLSILLHSAAAVPSGGMSIPLGIAGTIARKAGESMTRRDIAALERMIRERSPEAQRWAAIQARINAANPQGALGAPAGGLLGGVLAAPQQFGILPYGLVRP